MTIAAMQPSPSKERVSRRGGTARNFAFGAFALVLGLFGAQASFAAPLQIECDVQFQVPAFLKDNATKNNITPDYLPTVPLGLTFRSYWLSIDWGTAVAKVYVNPFPLPENAPPIATYKIASQPAWPLIELTNGTGTVFVPIIFYIRRASGWFMQQLSLSPDHKDAAGNPVVDIVEVGVCGGQPKF